MAHESAWELTLFVKPVLVAKWHCISLLHKFLSLDLNCSGKCRGLDMKYLRKHLEQGRKWIYISSQGNLFRGKLLWVEIQLPPRLFFQAGFLLWWRVASNSPGEFLTKGTVIIKENFCVSKTVSREWVFMNEQQKIKGKMEKFWGLSGRTLPRFSGVCFCRSVTMMGCLCRVCTGFRSAGKMCHWDL